MTIEDARLAKASRLIRRDARMRQTDITTSRFVCQEIEAGRAGQLKVDQVRAHFAALGAKAQISVWKDGAVLDRLIDRAHAEIVEMAVAILTRHGYRVRTEFTFNDFGDRGSIDVFGGNYRTRAVFVGKPRASGARSRKHCDART